MTDPQPAKPQKGGLVASTLAYVRTPDGVVEVQRGEPAPDAADAEHLDDLRKKGVFVTADVLAKLDKAEQKA